MMSKSLTKVKWLALAVLALALLMVIVIFSVSSSLNDITLLSTWSTGVTFDSKENFMKKLEQASAVSLTEKEAQNKVDTFKASVEEQVASGEITQEEADVMMDNYEKTVDKYVSGNTGKRTVELSATAEQVKTTLLSSSSYSSKANTLAYAYDKLISAGYTSDQVIGVMANISAEGNIGLVQYGYKLCGEKSTPNSPVIIRTSAQMDEAYNKSLGVGICQWTYYTRRQPLIDAYRARLNAISDTQLSDTDLLEVEVEYLLTELDGYKYKELTSGFGYDDCTEWICLNYEKPADKESKASERKTNSIGLAELLSNN